MLEIPLQEFLCDPLSISNSSEETKRRRSSPSAPHPSPPQLPVRPIRSFGAAEDTRWGWGVGKRSTTEIRHCSWAQPKRLSKVRGGDKQHQEYPGSETVERLTGSDKVATRWQRVTATLFRGSALTSSLTLLEALCQHSSLLPRSTFRGPLSFPSPSFLSEGFRFPCHDAGFLFSQLPCLLPLLATPSVGRRKLLLPQTSKSCVAWKLSTAGDRVPLASACHQPGWGPAALHDERLLACFMSPSQMS